MFDNAIVAGGGPSLKQIDYSRLPQDFDVFRVNFFYFEDKYYLGNKVKICTTFPENFFQYYYAIHQLKQKNEYQIDAIACAFYGIQCVFEKKYHFLQKNFKALFPDALNPLEIKEIYPFLAFHSFRKLYLDTHLIERTGIYTIALACALGYKKIYLAGFDTYQPNANNYAFDITLGKYGGGGATTSRSWHSKWPFQ